MSYEIIQHPDSIKNQVHAEAIGLKAYWIEGTRRAIWGII